MKIEVVIRGQVRDYLRRLAPQPRQTAKAALARLPEGDVKPLQAELEGFQRLRVGQHRFVFHYAEGRIVVFYAAPRTMVYEFLAANLRELLEP